MESNLGEAIGAFDTALKRFRESVRDDPILNDTLLAGADTWTAVLAHKLVPHLGGEGCLVVAVAGGTNTGKSTVFNRLVGHKLSPVTTTAAATRHPLLAGSRLRAQQCLDGMLLPEFPALELEDPEDVVSTSGALENLFVTPLQSLPDRLVFLDTPDVDSIDKQNWEVADNIRAAGDVLVAVLTGEKYKDERVVGFFRNAHASGRLILPLMNKADPDREFDVARKQLREFCQDVGIDNQSLLFVIPHDFAAAEDVNIPVDALDEAANLRGYIDALDVPELKRRVYRDSVEHFADEAGGFLNECERVADVLRNVEQEFVRRVRAHAEKYDPAPGAEIGGLFHSFVQAKRGPFRRAIGSAGATFAKAAGAVAKRVTGGLLERAMFESRHAGKGRRGCAAPEVEKELYLMHRQALEQIVRRLATSYLESAGNIREPAAHLVQAGIDRLDVDAAAKSTADDVLHSENISEVFREHAWRTIDSWWNDNTGKRRVLEALDTMLAVMPAAIAAPLSMYSAGFGVSEAIVVVGPMVEQFVVRVIEYQFGDQMFDLLSPWRKEQQEKAARALDEHVAAVCLADLRDALHKLEGENVTAMRQSLAECRKAL